LMRTFRTRRIVMSTAIATTPNTATSMAMDTLTPAAREVIKDAMTLVGIVLEHQGS